MMKYRTYGNTGKSVSELGFGAWQLGNDKDWTPMTDAEAISLVQHALDTGCNFFDTAPGYGQGRSETLLGKALKGHRDKVVINTKCGHSADGRTDYSATALRQSVEDSLRRLQTDHLDSVLLHNPPTQALNGNSVQFEVLAKLQEEGKILAFGASVDSSTDMFTVLNTSQSHVMEVLFNIFHQETAKAFEQSVSQETALVIKVPLDSGWLSGKYSAKSTFGGIRSRWSTEVIARRAQLVDEVRELIGGDMSLLDAALSFILAHAAVTTVIPGCKSVEQWDANLKASSVVMHDHLVHRLQDFWMEELERSPLPW